MRIFESAIAIGSVIVAGSLGEGATAGAARTGTGTSKWPPHPAAPAPTDAPTNRARKVTSLIMRGKLAALCHRGKRSIPTMKNASECLDSLGINP